MNQIERMTSSAQLMAAPFAARVQAFSGMTDEELANTRKQMGYAHSTMSLANMLANAHCEAAYKARNNLSALLAERNAARSTLAATPWYRPFKRAELKVAVSRSSSQIAAAKQDFVVNNYVAVFNRKQVAQAETPQMKQSSQVMREISQTLQARAEERKRLMSMDLRMRKHAHAERERVATLKRDNPSFAMQMVHEMADELIESSHLESEVAMWQSLEAAQAREERRMEHGGMRRVQVEREAPRY